MTTIEVRISKHKLAQLDHEVHIANYTLRKLREAGVPVVGGLWVKWLDDGMLAVHCDDHEIVYTWRGDKPLVKVVEEVEEIW